MRSSRSDWPLLKWVGGVHKARQIWRATKFALSPRASMPLASLPIRHTPLRALVRVTTSTLRISLHRHNLQVSRGIPCIFFKQKRVHSTRRVVPIRRATESPAEKLLKRVRIMGGGDHHHHHHDGHEHGHGDHGDISLLMSKDTSNPGVRITRVGLYSPLPAPSCILSFVDSSCLNSHLFCGAGADVVVGQ